MSARGVEMQSLRHAGSQPSVPGASQPYQPPKVTWFVACGRACCVAGVRVVLSTSSYAHACGRVRWLRVVARHGVVQRRKMLTGCAGCSNNWWKLCPTCCACWNCFPVPQLRKAVSQKKFRFKENGFNLDLSYLTPRIIIFGWPAVGCEHCYRNPRSEVVRFVCRPVAVPYTMWLCASPGCGWSPGFSRSATATVTSSTTSAAKPGVSTTPPSSVAVCR